jgi:hypothetical protein
MKKTTTISINPFVSMSNIRSNGEQKKRYDMKTCVNVFFSIIALNL